MYKLMSSKNKLTSSGFFEEFAPFFQDNSLSYRDFFMAGDTKLHLDKPADHNVNKFLDY